MPAVDYFRQGSGEPLLLVHGLGGDRSTWTPVIHSLAMEYDVVAPDLPGFGASPPVPAGGTPTPRALAEALACLLDDLGIGTAHIVGNSLGGWVALEQVLLGRARTVTTALCGGHVVASPRAGARATGAPAGPPARAPARRRHGVLGGTAAAAGRFRGPP